MVISFKLITLKYFIDTTYSWNGASLVGPNILSVAYSLPASPYLQVTNISYTGTNNFNISGLDPNTNYVISVWGYNTAGLSSVFTVSATTNPGRVICAKLKCANKLQLRSTRES